MLIFVEILLTDPLENADRKDCKDCKGLQAMVNHDPGVRERRERQQFSNRTHSYFYYEKPKCFNTFFSFINFSLKSFKISFSLSRLFISSIIFLLSAASVSLSFSILASTFLLKTSFISCSSFSSFLLCSNFSSSLWGRETIF